MKCSGMFFPGFMLLSGSLAIAEIQNVLHFKKIMGYNHKSGIRACSDALDNLSKQYGFAVKHSTDERDILNLKQYDVVVFDNTVANGGANKLLPSKEHQQALVDYLEGGGLYLGFSGSSDYDCTGWAWYHDTLYSGNCFRGYGGGEGTWTLEVDDDLIADPELSTMWEDAGFSKTIILKDVHKMRMRKFNDPSVRDDPDVKVLQKIIKEDAVYDDHYFTWTKRIGRGRMLYTASGCHQSDWTQNDKWLERATWYWMKYLDGQYANPITVRIENRQSKRDGTLPFETGFTRFYLLNGQIAATQTDGIHPGIDFFRSTGPGIYFGELKSPSGVTAKRLVIP